MTISLTGFMGCGKSSVGRRLSELLSCSFVDLDSVIEEREGRTIPEIFASDGETAFRQMEKEALEHILFMPEIRQCAPLAPSQLSLGPSPYSSCRWLLAAKAHRAICLPLERVGKCLLHTNGTSPEGGKTSSKHCLTPDMIRKVIIRIRKEKLPEPSIMGSAGSFFKNPVIGAEHFRRIEAAAKAEHGADYKVPHYIIERQPEIASDVVSAISGEGEDRVEKSVKIPAAWMIEQCGWKGRRSGGAAVYDKQPLVIVNYTGEAYPEEIISLERRIIASVKEKFGVELHPEVEHI